MRAGGGVGAGNNVGTARNAFVMGGAGHPLHSARGPASARGIGKVRYNSKGSVPAAGGVVSDQHSARGVLGQENTRGQRGGGESGQDSGRLSGRNTSGYYGGSGWPDATSNPAVRHEEALQKFERDVANKLMAVIDRKKLANLQVRCPFDSLSLFAVLHSRAAVLRFDVNTLWYTMVHVQMSRSTGIV